MSSYTSLYRMATSVALLILSFTNLKAQEQSPFVYGGSASIAISDYLNVDISPKVGYKPTPDFTVGLLAKYEYLNNDNAAEPYNANTYGFGAYAQYNISPLFTSQALPFNIYAHTEYQYLRTEIGWKHQHYTTSYTQSRWFVGGGFSVPFGAKSSFYTTIMYDILAVIENKRDEYSSKPVVSVGVQF